MANNLSYIGIAVLMIAASTPVAAAQQAVLPSQTNTSPGQTHRATVPEDSGKWRREPFIGIDLKKNNLPNPKNLSAKQTTPEQSRLPELDLQGIIQTDKTFHALINGRIVKTGDKFGDLTIKDISRFRVVIQDEKKEKFIYDVYQGRIDRGKK